MNKTFKFIVNISKTQNHSSKIENLDLFISETNMQIEHTQYQNLRSLVNEFLQLQTSTLEFQSNQINNNKLLLIIHQFQIDVPVISNNSNIFIQFVNCQINTSDQLDYHLSCFKNCEIEILKLPQYNTMNIDNFNSCRINTLDLQKFEDIKFEQLFITQKIILPQQIKNLQLLLGISTIYFQNSAFLTKISLDCSILKDINICENSIIDSKIDFSKFQKLESISLTQLNCDILLPDTLEYLNLSQEKQFYYKILNKTLNSNFISIDNFDINDNEFLGYETITLLNCKAKNITSQYQPQQQNHYQHLRQNVIESLIISPRLKQLCICQNTIENLIFYNKDLEILSLENVELTRVLIQENQGYQTSIINENINAKENVLDFSYFTNLLTMTFYNLGNKMIFPLSLQSLKLYSNSQRQEIQDFDLSLQYNLQLLEIQSYRIDNLKMYQLQFLFNTDLETNILISLDQRKSVEIGQQTFQQFANSITSLKCSGIKQIIFNNQQATNLDFNVFKNLKTLELKNIYNMILPLEDINPQFEQNLECQNLKGLYLKISYCKINKLITSHDSHININRCLINVLQADGQIYDTVIKTYIQNKEQKSIYMADNSLSIENIILKDFSILQKLEISGLKKIIFGNSVEQSTSIFDFTKFNQLTQVFLLNVDCSGIIFGKSQISIQISSRQQKRASIQFLDFSQCQDYYLQGYKNIVIHAYDVGQLIVGCNEFNFYDTRVKFMNLCKIEHDEELIDDICNYNCYHNVPYEYRDDKDNYYNTESIQENKAFLFCQYIIDNQDNTKQRIWYKLQSNQDKKWNGEYQASFTINRAIILECKINYINQKIIDLLNE